MGRVMYSNCNVRESLEIGSNNTLLVEEGTSARITHYDLRFIHYKYKDIEV